MRIAVIIKGMHIICTMYIKTIVKTRTCLLYSTKGVIDRKSIQNVVVRVKRSFSLFPTYFIGEGVEARNHALKCFDWVRSSSFRVTMNLLDLF